MLIIQMSKLRHRELNTVSCQSETVNLKDLNPQNLYLK